MPRSDVLVQRKRSETPTVLVYIRDTTHHRENAQCKTTNSSSLSQHPTQEDIVIEGWPPKRNIERNKSLAIQSILSMSAKVRN
jgi:hypothetical protein